jgi:ADP-heptose:LPS heptosyltransferase
MGLWTDLAIDAARRFGRTPAVSYGQLLGRPGRVLIFPAQGDGEVLWALPALRALRRHYSDSLLCLMLDEQRRSLWHFDDEVDEIIDFRPELLKGCRSPEFKRLNKMIKSRQFKLLVNLDYRSHRLMDYLFYKSVPGLRLGPASSDGFPFKNFMVRERDLLVDEALRNLALIKFLGVNADEHHLSWPRLVDAEGRREFRERLKLEGLQRGQMLWAIDAAPWKPAQLSDFLNKAGRHPGLKLMLINPPPELHLSAGHQPMVLNSTAVVEQAEALSFAKAYIGVKNDLFSIAYLLKVPCLIAARQGERGLPQTGESLQIVDYKGKPEFPRAHAEKMLQALN